MAIYTGNNGRVYIARRNTNVLTGSNTVNISPGQSVVTGNKFKAITTTGKGSGAIFRADETKGAGQPCSFTVDNGGLNYLPTDTIYLAKQVGNTNVRITPNFVVGTTLGVGIDTEAELVNTAYRIAKIRDWSFTSNSEVIETTALGDTTKSFAPSVTSGDGSATLLFYEDELNEYGANSMKDIYELVDILFPRDVAPSVLMSLAVDGGTYTVDDGTELSKSNFMFNAFITSASVSVSYGEVVAVSTNFTVNGPLLDVPWKPGVSRL